MSQFFTSGGQITGVSASASVLPVNESEVIQSCLTLCDPVDCSLPRSSIYGIFQARILEWVATSFSRGSSQPRDWTWVSRIVGRHFTVWATREALPMNIQDWFPLGWTGWISLRSKELSRVLQHRKSKASILLHSAFLIVQFLNPHMTAGKTIALTRWTFVGKVTSLLFNMLFRLVVTFLPRSKHLFISWLQSPSAVILEPKTVKSEVFVFFLPTHRLLSGFSWALG